MPEVAIVDAGMGNIGSVANMCRKIGVDAAIASTEDALGRATHVLLPGVGSYDSGMKRLRATGLLPFLERRVQVDHVPVLGVCLGMQLLFDGSEEGSETGLGWIPGRVRRLSAIAGTAPVRIPHMGWNTLDIVRPSPLWRHLDDAARFYFVHSFAPVPDDDADVVARTHHGVAFVSAVGRGNIMGVQFHPEKSHRHGMALLRAFVDV